MIIENEIGEISQIFIATDSQDIGYWSVPIPDMYYGLPGADFDGQSLRTVDFGRASPIDSLQLIAQARAGCRC